MVQVKLLIIVGLVMLVLGLVAGFILRPIIAPTAATVEITGPAPVAAASAEARGTQYFVAHIDEARQVVAGCHDGSVRGGECANAEEAIIKVDAQERRRRFLGN